VNQDLLELIVQLKHVEMTVICMVDVSMDSVIVSEVTLDNFVKLLLVPTDVVVMEYVRT